MDSSKNKISAYCGELYEAARDLLSAALGWLYLLIAHGFEELLDLIMSIALWILGGLLLRWRAIESRVVVATAGFIQPRRFRILLILGAEMVYFLIYWEKVMQSYGKTFALIAPILGVISLLSSGGILVFLSKIFVLLKASISTIWTVAKIVFLGTSVKTITIASALASYNKLEAENSWLKEQRESVKAWAKMRPKAMFVAWLKWGVIDCLLSLIIIMQILPVLIVYFIVEGIFKILFTKQVVARSVKFLWKKVKRPRVAFVSAIMSIFASVTPIHVKAWWEKTEPRRNEIKVIALEAIRLRLENRSKQS